MCLPVFLTVILGWNAARARVGAALTWAVLDAWLALRTGPPAAAWLEAAWSHTAMPSSPMNSTMSGTQRRVGVSDAARRERTSRACLLSPSDAADDLPCVELGGARLIH